MSDPAALPEVHEKTTLGRIAAGLAIVGGLLMLSVSAMVTASVIMRKVMDTSVPGDIELVQISTALSVFAFLPLCQWHRGNIMVDTFTTWMPAAWQRGLDALWDIVYAITMAIIAWRLFVGAADTIRSSTVSMQLGLPTGWAIGACAAMATFLVIVAVATAFRRARGGT
jgi:TRAP-type C4-dicarboxylate transport system permease small subunit